MSLLKMIHLASISCTAGKKRSENDVNAGIGAYSSYIGSHGCLRRGLKGRQNRISGS